MDLPSEKSGVDFDRDGPRVGSVRLLTKTALGFSGRRAAELAMLFPKGSGVTVDNRRLEAALQSIANAMNAGDLVATLKKVGVLQ